MRLLENAVHIVPTSLNAGEIIRRTTCILGRRSSDRPATGLTRFVILLPPAGHLKDSRRHSRKQMLRSDVLSWNYRTPLSQGKG
jgi:hypothetical protein